MFDCRYCIKSMIYSTKFMKSMALYFVAISLSMGLKLCSRTKRYDKYKHDKWISANIKMKCHCYCNVLLLKCTVTAVALVVFVSS